MWEPADRLSSRAQIGQEYGVGEDVVRRAQELLIPLRERPDGSPFQADMKAVGRQGDR